MSVIKVDVISGFLGAGKTTLLKRYAAYRIRQGEKIAIIENEFGEVGIDGLFLQNSGLSVHEIVNGCICCSLKGDIIATLKELADQRNVSRVIIEPTGVFMLNEIYDIIATPDIADFYEIGAVVTVVDAKNFLKQKAKYSWFFSNQIKWAHRLVLSKTGLVDKETLLKTIQQIQQIADSLDIEASDWEEADDGTWERIFAGGFESGGEHPAVLRTLRRHNGFKGMSLSFARTFDEKSLAQRVQMLASGSFGDIPRAKGIVSNEAGGSLEFDYVDGDMNLRCRPEPIEKSIISFIGTGMRRDELSALFDS